MDHANRLKLAHGIAQKLTDRYPAQLALVGLIGSVARNEETSWSDLDLLVVVHESVPVRSILFQGIVVSFVVIEQTALEHSLREPGLGWPFYMGLLETVEVLTGTADQLKQWHNLGLTPTERAFRLTLERELPGLVFESYGRIRSCSVRDNKHDAIPSVVEMLNEMLTALCLLNRRWVTRDYYGGFVQSFSFIHLPSGWEQLVSQLWMARELPEIVTMAGQLMAAYWQLLTARGVNIPNYQTIESLSV